MKKPQSKFVTIIIKILLFILVYLASMLVIGIVGTYIYIDTFNPVFSITIILAPIALAVLAILPWGKKVSAVNTAAPIKVVPSVNYQYHPVPYRESSSTVPTIQTTYRNQPFYNSTSSTNRFKPTYCAICGTILTNNAAYCAQCGAEVYVAPVAKADTSPMKTAGAAVENSNTATIQNSGISNDGISTKPKFTEASGKLGKVYRVTGVQHYATNLLNLACENSDYDMSKREIVDNFMTGERIYKYDFYGGKVTLLPEPTNPYDPNAIKVIVDGEHIGYIKKGSCKHLLKVISENRIHGIDCDIGGGPYKYVYENDDDYGKCEVDRGDANYYVSLHIRELE